MGGGIVGWLTPGWMTMDKTLSPHVATPGKVNQWFNNDYSICKANDKRRREPKTIVDRRLQTTLQELERKVGEMRSKAWTYHQDQSH